MTKLYWKTLNSRSRDWIRLGGAALLAGSASSARGAVPKDFSYARRGWVFLQIRASLGDRTRPCAPLPYACWLRANQWAGRLLVSLRINCSSPKF